MAPRQPHQNDEIDDVLRYINDVLKTEAYDHRFFVPKLALRKYLTPERVKKLLQISCPHPIDWEEVYNRYLAVFVILLSIQEGIHIANFLQHSNLADAHLPFTEASIWPPECRKFFKEFDEIQWEYCAQNLGPDDLHDKVLHPKIVVPIKSQHLLKSGDSRTSKVEVHPDYNGFLSPSQCDSNVASPRFFVLKTSPYRYENLHKNETRAYTILRRQEDISENIVRFHGSWKQSDSCNILLEYVEGGTLEDLFLSNWETAWDVLSFWTRLLDILKPVCRIHCQGDPKSYDRVDHGVHQDIKPQNILVARNPSSITFAGSFKLADLGLAYVPVAETKKCQERWGRDVPGTQMYSAPECFCSEAELFLMRTVRPVDCKKDIWSLACVLSEAVVWCVLGVTGLSDYRARRRAETTKLPKLHRTAYNGCFHDGKKVLPAVQEFHDKVRRSRGAYDQIINDILPIIEEMFEHVEQRLDARSACTKFTAAIATANRLSIPAPFRVSPETMHTPQFSRRSHGAAMGLESKHSPTHHSHAQTGQRLPDNTEPISLPSSSRLSNGVRDPSTDTFLDSDSVSFAPEPYRRSLTDRPVPTRSMPPSDFPRPCGSGRSAPGASSHKNIQPLDRRRLDHSTASADDQAVRVSGGEIRVGVEEHHTPAKRALHATVPQLSRWLKEERHASFPSPCPFQREELDPLHETDQIFIVDNSESMRPYRREVEETFAVLSHLVKRLDRDGMDLYFTNSSVTGHGYHRRSMLSKLNNVVYRGETYMDLTLGKVLESSNVKRSSLSALFRRENNVAKSIYILTDGKWYGEDDSLCGIPKLVESATANIGSRWKLGIQFIQFGSDEVGTRRLKQLDDGLQNLGIMDIIDTEPHNGNVYKMLLGHRTDTWD